MAFDGRHVIAEGFAAAQAGGGWIDYEVLNPTNGVVDAKTSFILPLGADILIGCDAPNLCRWRRARRQRHPAPKCYIPN